MFPFSMEDFSISEGHQLSQETPRTTWEENIERKGPSMLESDCHNEKDKFVCVVMSPGGLVVHALCGACTAKKHADTTELV